MGKSLVNLRFQIQKKTSVDVHWCSYGAEGRTRTGTPEGGWFWINCVYQFRHSGTEVCLENRLIILAWGTLATIIVGFQFDWRKKVHLSYRSSMNGQTCNIHLSISNIEFNKSQSLSISTHWLHLFVHNGLSSVVVVITEQ